eukprot:1151960-Pelagomonas_calceolata.AAC.1
MRGELMWIRWVSGSTVTLLQGTSIMMSVFIAIDFFLSKKPRLGEGDTWCPGPRGYKGYKGKRPKSRRLTASLSILWTGMWTFSNNAHEIIKERRKLVVVLMWIDSDEFGKGVGFHVFSPDREEHESSSGLCVENLSSDGKVDSRFPGHSILVINGMAD